MKYVIDIANAKIKVPTMNGIKEMPLKKWHSWDNEKSDEKFMNCTITFDLPAKLDDFSIITITDPDFSTESGMFDMNL